MDSKTRTYLALKIIRFIGNLPKDIATQIIAKQLLRAAMSIGANIEVDEIANILGSSILTLKGKRKL